MCRLPGETTLSPTLFHSNNPPESRLIKTNTMSDHLSIPEESPKLAPVHIFTRPPDEFLEEGEDAIWNVWENSTEEERLKVPAPPLQNPRSIKFRITQCVRVLNDFSNLAEPNIPRWRYVRCLASDLAHLYDYNIWLVLKFLQILPPSEVVELLEANEAPRPLTIRVNTLKTRRRDLARTLISTRGMKCDPLQRWCPTGLIIYDSPVPVGGTPEYLAGHYVVQAAASFVPVLALAPKPEETILDLCAAPGGKTTHIAAMMNNTGIIVANDISAERARGLIANLARLGVSNTVVTTYDGRGISRIHKGFHRALVDAPCTGTGVISKEPSVKASRSSRDLKVLTEVQKGLLLAAIDSVRPADGAGHPGVIVYSTCSMLVEENECVVQYALAHRDVEIVPCGVNLGGRPLGRDGFVNIGPRTFHPNMRHARRLYPHVHNMDGFFICKLVKRSNQIRGERVVVPKSLPLSKRVRPPLPSVTPGPTPPETPTTTQLHETRGFGQ